MALQEEKGNRMARAIIKIVHECDAGMKQGVAYYRNAHSPEEAFGQLQRAVRLPYRIEARVQELVTKHGASVINSVLAQVATVKLADLQAELAPLKTYSDVLKNHYQIDGWTQEQIAVDIETNRADIDQDESAPIPVGYTDDF